MKYLKENWLWLVVPLLIVIALIAVAVWSGGGAMEQHTYPLR